MKKTKLFSLTILSVLLLGTIGGVVGYQEYIYRWINNGAGGTHGACHGSANTKASVLGTLVLTVNETGNLSPGQPFELSVAVLNFTEANLDPYDGRFTLGVPGYQGDNAKFSSALSHQTLNRRESVDSYGSYNHSGSNNEFDLFAPTTAGTFDLVAVAIAGINQTDLTAYNLTFVQDSIQVTVVGSMGTQATISGGVLTVIISSTLAVSTVLIIVMRKRLRKREL
ncbi:MAG: hypothetical protein ACW986_10185 [Promethearchaeota archaeon]